MSISRLQIMTKCRHCGRPMLITQTRSLRADPSMELVRMTQRVAMEQALCRHCQMAMKYYVSQGRLEDWEKGNV